MHETVTSRIFTALRPKRQTLPNAFSKYNQEYFRYKLNERGKRVCFYYCYEKIISKIFFLIPQIHQISYPCFI